MLGAGLIVWTGPMGAFTLNGPSFLLSVWIPERHVHSDSVLATVPDNERVLAANQGGQVKERRARRV